MLKKKYILRDAWILDWEQSCISIPRDNWKSSGRKFIAVMLCCQFSRRKDCETSNRPEVCEGNEHQKNFRGSVLDDF